MTLSTESFENDPFTHDLELLLNAFGYSQIIIGLTVKVVHIAAFQTMKVMMRGQICIKTLCATENFDHIQDPDFRKSQQRAVDRVKGDMRIFFSQDLIDSIGRWMGVHAQKILINRDPLRGNFKPMPLADLYKFMELIHIGFFLHIYPK
ncbi:MAG: hypothetical protein R6V60_10815 [Desulfobacterales bacterium]